MCYRRMCLVTLYEALIVRDGSNMSVHFRVSSLTNLVVPYSNLDLKEAACDLNIIVTPPQTTVGIRTGHELRRMRILLKAIDSASILYLATTHFCFRLGQGIDKFIT